MRTKKSLALTFAILLASTIGVTAFSQSRVLYSKDGLSLAYELYPQGSRDITVQPGVTEKMQYYEFRAIMRNDSGKDIKLNGSADVSFFMVSTQWAEGGAAKVAFSPGVLKSGASLSAASTFLLDPSNKSPGEPSWSVPEYAFAASSGSAPGAPERMSNAALIDRYALLYKSFQAGSTSTADNDELRALIMEIMNRTQAGKFTPEELQRYLDAMKN